jgi:uncharacterized membrane protein
VSKTSIDALVEEYLFRLRATLAPLGDKRQSQLISEISDHIAESISALDDPSEADVRNVLDRIGPPEDIAAEAADLEQAPVPPRGSGTQESLAIALLLVGGFLIVVGWFVGVILLWTSTVWRLRDKVIGTFLLPGGLLPAVVLVSHGAIRSSSESCTYIDNQRPVCTSTSTGPGLSVPLLLVLLAVAVVVPVGSAFYLNRRRRTLPSSPAPMKTGTRVVLGIGGGVVVVSALIFILLGLVSVRTGISTSSSGSASVAGSFTLLAVVGETAAQAQSQLTTEGLNVKVTSASSLSVPAGTVAFQQPTAGTSVTSRSIVHLSISAGP